MIGFNTPNGYNEKQILIIDPWVTNYTTLPVSNFAYDVDYDYAGNYYVCGGDVGPFSIAKYSTAGLLLWTFNGVVPSVGWSSNSTGWGFYGSFAVDKMLGKCYMADCVSATMGAQSEVIRIDQNGLYDNLISYNPFGGSFGAPDIDEIWGLLYNHTNGLIYVFDGLFYPEAAILNTTTGALSPQNLSGNTTAPNQDIVSQTIDCNGNIFALYAGVLQGQGNCLLRANPAFNGNNWIAPTTYTSFSEGANLWYNLLYSSTVVVNSNSYNALAVNTNYLYYYDGFNLAAYDKNTGSKIGATTIIGSTIINGQNTKGQGGIAVDECNNVYVGGNGAIICYNFNGTSFVSNGTIPIGISTNYKSITDIQYKPSSNELYVCGTGFGGIYSAINSITCTSVQTSVTTQCPIGSAIATVSTNVVNPVVSYSWTNSSNVVVSQTANSVLLTNTATGLANGNYTLYAQINAPCGPIQTQTFNINCSSCILTPNISSNNSSCNSLTGNLIISSVTNGTPSYTIMEGNTTIANTINTPYTINNISVGSHTYVLSSANGCNTTFTTTILNGATIPNLTAATPVMLSCNPNLATLSATSSVSGSPSYSWAGPGIQSGANTANPIVNVAGNYTVTITSGLCTNTAVVAVINNTNIPNVTINQTGILTCTQPVTLTANSSAIGATYLWSPQNVASNTVVIANVGNYSVVVTNTANGCSATKTIAVVNPNLFTANTNTTSISCFGLNDGKIQLTVNGGVGPFSITTLNTNTTITPVSIFPFNLSNLSAANYSILIQDNTTGCNQLLNTTIQEPNLLQLSPLSNFSICAGETTTLNTLASGGTLPYKYLWWPNGSTTSNLIVATTNSSITTIKSISLTVTDNNGCKISSAIQSTIYPIPDVQFSPKHLTGCAPICTTFSITSAQNPNYSYNWLFSYNASSSSPTLSNAYQPHQCFNLPGNYNIGLDITNSFGCTSKQIYRDFLEVYSLPIANFSFTPNPANELDPLIHFTNMSSNANYYNWDFGDPNSANISSSQIHPNYSYSNAGNYLVTLMAYSSKGCVDTIYKHVIIEEDFAIYIPNTFTPDDNNLNDDWGPKGVGISKNDYHLLVFDRWGQKLFSSMSIDNKWNGTFKNKPVNDDVYIYKLNCKSVNGGKLKTFMGHVTVQR